MSRSFAELLPTPLDAQSLSELTPLSRVDDLLLLLERWVERGWLRALDRAFVAFLSELDPQADSLVLLAAALTSHQLGHGHVCLDLYETLKEPDFALSLPPEGDVQAGPMLLPSQLLVALDGGAWCQALAASALPGPMMTVKRQRTSHWCYRIGVCICAVTGITNDASMAHCVSDWRNRKPRLRTWRNDSTRCSARLIRRPMP